MYQIIAKTPNVFEKYAAKLIAEGTITKEGVQEHVDRNNKRLEQAYEKSRTQKFEQENWILKPAEDILESTRHGPPRDTGVEINILRDLGKKITTIPEGFTAHPQLKKIYEARYKSIEEGKGIDWATAESLAFASLAADGYGVRLSGEDVERGTFSHRHCVVWDQNRDTKYVPIKQLLPEQDRYRVTSPTLIFLNSVSSVSNMVTLLLTPTSLPSGKPNSVISSMKLKSSLITSSLPVNLSGVPKVVSSCSCLTVMMVKVLNILPLDSKDSWNFLMIILSTFLLKNNINKIRNSPSSPVTSKLLLLPPLPITSIS